LCKCDYM